MKRIGAMPGVRGLTGVLTTGRRVYRTPSGKRYTTYSQAEQDQIYRNTRRRRPRKKRDLYYDT